MSHPVDWDVEQYKVASESEQQWKLRRDFLEKWKAEIPEDRLVCLARVFINVEFLGCRYPLPVMKQIAELSKEVAANFREQKKHKLQRTFVSASDAAEDRAKGTKKRRSENSQSKNTVFVAAQHQDSSRQNYNKPPAKNDNLISNRYGNLILYDRTTNETFTGKLTSSCQTCKVKIEWILEKNDDWLCKCIVNNIEVSTGTGESQKLAKENSAELSWKILQKDCYTIKMKQSHVSKEDTKISAVEIRTDQKKPPIVDKLDVKVESAVASRMMKLMGWSGGSLGAKSDGISEPIAPNLKQIHRAGLGSSSDNSKAIEAAMRRVISEFKNTGNSDYDLVFANDFTKEERIEMHKLALRYGLKSKSYGRSEDRYLVISKYLSPAQLVQSLLDSGGSNDKYTLSPPTR